MQPVSYGLPVRKHIPARLFRGSRTDGDASEIFTGGTLEWQKVEEKQPVVQAISEAVNGAASVVVVDYRGLTVTEDTELRKTLRENNVSYKVYKNTMMNFAFKGTEFEALSGVLEGPNAIAVSKDDATRLQEFLQISQRRHPTLKSRPVSLKDSFMMQQA